MFGAVGASMYRPLKATSSRCQPWQVASAVSLGVFAGMTFSNGGLGLIVLLLLFLLPVHFLAGVCSALLTSGLLWLTEPWLGQLGQLALDQTAIRERVLQANNMPLLPWLRLNNSVAMGGLVLGLLQVLPTLLIARWIASGLRSDFEMEYPAEILRLDRAQEHALRPHIAFQVAEDSSENYGTESATTAEPIPSQPAEIAAHAAENEPVPHLDLDLPIASHDAALSPELSFAESKAALGGGNSKDGGSTEDSTSTKTNEAVSSFDAMIDMQELLERDASTTSADSEGTLHASTESDAQGASSPEIVGPPHSDEFVASDSAAQEEKRNALKELEELSAALQDKLQQETGADPSSSDGLSQQRGLQLRVDEAEPGSRGLEEPIDGNSLGIQSVVNRAAELATLVDEMLVTLQDEEVHPGGNRYEMQKMPAPSSYDIPLNQQLSDDNHAIRKSDSGDESPIRPHAAHSSSHDASVHSSAASQGSSKAVTLEEVAQHEEALRYLLKHLKEIKNRV